MIGHGVRSVWPYDVLRGWDYIWRMSRKASAKMKCCMEFMCGMLYCQLSEYCLSCRDGHAWSKSTTVQLQSLYLWITKDNLANYRRWRSSHQLLQERRKADLRAHPLQNPQINRGLTGYMKQGTSHYQWFTSFITLSSIVCLSG